MRSREGYWSMFTYTGQRGQNVLGQILVNFREFVRKKPGDGKSGSPSTPER